MKYYLGWDLSTSCSAYAILDEKGQLIEFDALEFKNKKKFPSLFEKAAAIQQKLIELKGKYNIVSVFIEEPLKKFKYHRSSAQTIAILWQFNGFISQVCYSVFGFAPENIAVGTARKVCKIAIPKKTNAKPIVLKHIQSTETSFTPAMTKFGNVQTKYYDMADAIVIARAGFKMS
jgi:hypothetical protein